MQLNIYTISHPIIELLSNSTIYNSRDESNAQFYYKHIGLFLLYEVLRKQIKIEKIYVKYTYSIKDLCLISPCTKNCILTNLKDTYSMLGDIKILMPSIEIINVKYDNYKLDIIDKTKLLKLQEKYNNLKILILENNLKNDTIINLIDNLKNENKILIKDIKIACITSYYEILNKLGKIYPKLVIYTTKIVNIYTK
uniref:Uracil phosphoribosyltransferase n=1 Tax=Cliftonaea pectinata TaxID=2007206 RepID=A0A1Z1MQ52_9FLOR|nr:uracil phosphoribosyltransferase [Cliftonaea pectinata]ARW68066.1 uracil phosphoribosyltransferase [Cliftonaea pectinata]